jgi:hypothetical protein
MVAILKTPFDNKKNYASCVTESAQPVILIFLKICLRSDIVLRDLIISNVHHVIGYVFDYWFYRSHA